jgi:arginine deiminase
VRLKIGGDTIITKKTINVLGVIFDTNLQWTEHLAKATTKSNHALNGFNLLESILI